MILVADSGSTKCDWKLIDGTETVVSTSTIGLNPFYKDEKVVAETMTSNFELVEFSAQVSEIYFYGAGCSSDEKNQIVERGLKSVFSNAKIHVEHDVYGAALAACHGEIGIACILGTGSNSCYYDGQKIHQVVPNLGYILGDEGSGGWFGKQLLRDYLYQEKIPAALREKLVQQGFDRESILNRIYRQPNANVFLASFAKMLHEFQETDYVKKLIRGGLKEFLTRHVVCFENHREVQVNFVGSIAFYFKPQLIEEAQKLGIRVGNIIQKPIDGLVAYHIGFAAES